MQPLTCTKWQTSKDNADKFTYDGEFKANKKVTGDWVALGQVASIDEFKSSEGLTVDEKIAIKQVSLKKDGTTRDKLIIWTGSTLMNLNKYEALKMQVKKVVGVEYLFVESGGFNSRNKADGKSPWIVMKRTK